MSQPQPAAPEKTPTESTASPAAAPAPRVGLSVRMRAIFAGISAKIPPKLKSFRFKKATASAAHPEPDHAAAPAAPKVPLKERIREWVSKNKPSPQEAVGVIREINASLGSEDVRQSRAAFAFYLNVLGILLVVSLTGKQLWDHRAQLKNLAAIEKARVESERETLESRIKQHSISLGQFNLELKNPANGQRVPAQLINIAEVEVVVECDSAETCASIESQMLVVRNQLTNTFTAVDRDELLTKNGKRKLKMAIGEAVNSWLPKGHVKSVYFSRLIIT